ncbi:MAG TPA: transposase [Gemmatimonadota bacterium]|nr:transposase [Gemmatimonadota bacterium]
MPNGSGGGRKKAPKAAHRLYAQVAWPTLGGLPLVDERRAAALERELIALCRRVGAEPLEVRVSSDRVQLLLRFGPGQPVSDLARRLKRASAASLRRWGWAARWGRGFAACTVGPGQVHRLLRRMRSEPRGTAPGEAGRDGPRAPGVPASRPARRGRERPGG